MADKFMYLLILIQVDRRRNVLAVPGAQKLPTASVDYVETHRDQPAEQNMEVYHRKTIGKQRFTLW